METIGGIALIAGAMFVLLAGVGVVRFDEIFARMHSAAKGPDAGVAAHGLGTALILRTLAADGHRDAGARPAADRRAGRFARDRPVGLPDAATPTSTPTSWRTPTTSDRRSVDGPGAVRAQELVEVAGALALDASG
jgi:hypothetical protein